MIAGGRDAIGRLALITVAVSIGVALLLGTVAGLNAVTRMLHVADAAGRPDGRVTIPMPIFHVFNLMSDLRDRFWILPYRPVGGHAVGHGGGRTVTELAGP